MSIKSDLKKDGIKVVEQLDTLKTNSIAKNISQKICATFPEYNLNQNELFIKLSRINMFIASMPEGLAEANYFYKNNSIYFNKYIELDDIEEFAVHECIHCIQTIKDSKNNLIKMGLCDYTGFNINGLALNEAAVQLMSSKILSIPKDFVKYFSLNFETISPTYYPLECCLINQMSYIVGEDILFESTINSNDNFKNRYISLTSSKSFYTIQSYFDKILECEEKITRLSNRILELNDEKKVQALSIKIQTIKNKITNIFLKTQNLIISSYFDKTIKEIQTISDINNYRKRLYDFKDYLATNENYTFFDNYYISKISELEFINNKLSGSSVTLNIIKKETNIFRKLINYIKKVLSEN